MNAYTTIEESKQLIEAGLDINTADMYFPDDTEITEIREKPRPIEYIEDKGYSSCWSLAVLLNIINNSNISYILGNNHNSESGYIISVKVRNSEGKFQVFDFDKIIGCITWLLEHDYIKSKVY